MVISLSTEARLKTSVLPVNLKFNLQWRGWRGNPLASAQRWPATLPLRKHVDGETSLTSAVVSLGGFPRDGVFGRGKTETLLRQKDCLPRWCLFIFLSR